MIGTTSKEAPSHHTVRDSSLQMQRKGQKPYAPPSKRSRRNSRIPLSSDVPLFPKHSAFIASPKHSNYPYKQKKHTIIKAQLLFKLCKFTSYCNMIQCVTISLKISHTQHYLFEYINFASLTITLKTCLYSTMILTIKGLSAPGTPNWLPQGICFLYVNTDVMVPKCPSELYDRLSLKHRLIRLPCERFNVSLAQ